MGIRTTSAIKLRNAGSAKLSAVELQSVQKRTAQEILDTLFVGDWASRPQNAELAASFARGDNLENLLQQLIPDFSAARLRKYVASLIARTDMKTYWSQHLGNDGNRHYYLDANPFKVGSYVFLDSSEICSSGGIHLGLVWHVGTSGGLKAGILLFEDGSMKVEVKDLDSLQILFHSISILWDAANV